MNELPDEHVWTELVPLYKYLLGNDEPTFYGVKLTHTPTGIWSYCAEFRSQRRNKTKALKRLIAALDTREEMTGIDGYLPF